MNTPSITANLAYLQQNPYFKDVPESQLQWLLDNSTCQELQEGEYLFEPDKEITCMYIILCGRIRLFVVQQN